MRKRIHILCTTLALSIFFGGTLGHMTTHAQETDTSQQTTKAEVSQESETKKTYDTSHGNEAHAEQEESENKKTCDSSSSHEDEVPFNHIGELTRNPLRDNRRSNLKGDKSHLIQDQFVTSDQYQRKNYKCHKGSKHMKLQSKSRYSAAIAHEQHEQELSEDDEEEDPR